MCLSSYDLNFLMIARVDGPLAQFFDGYAACLMTMAQIWQHGPTRPLLEGVR